ncbi:MAG: carboxypeptidase-like regulatory domain-containing protein [Bacillota bacterium]
MRLKRVLTIFTAAALTFCLLGASLPALAGETVVEIYAGAWPFTGSIQGKVTGETAAGTVYPVAGALVTAWRVERPPAPPAWGVWGKENPPPGIAKRSGGLCSCTWTTTDRDGKYRLDDLPGGAYVLTVRAPWYPLVRVPVQVVPGTTVTQNVYLQKAYGAVGGVVYDVYDKALLDRATVVLFSGSDCKPLLKGKRLKWKDWELDLSGDLSKDDQEPRLRACGAKVCRTDKTGCYHFNAPPGTHRLLVVRPGYEPVLQTVEIKMQQLTRQDVGLKKVPPPPAPAIKLQAQKKWKFNQKFKHQKN